MYSFYHHELSTLPNAANGSACSQDMGTGGRAFSGKLSGTATSINKTSSIAMAVANATAKFSPYAVMVHAPKAGLITMLAANVAETLK